MINKFERIRGGREMATTGLESCANCGIDSKCRRRDFSEQAWSVLLLWSEVQSSTIDQAICDGCYNELREVLIDRADEIEETLAESQGKVSSSANRGDSPTDKERKAS